MDIYHFMNIRVWILNLDENWYNKKIDAHGLGVNCVSWGPAFHPITFQRDKESCLQNSLAPIRFVTGGCDNKVKIWEITDDEMDVSGNQQLSIKNFKNTKVLSNHTDWVRDVNWLNFVGYAFDTIVSCSEVYQINIGRNCLHI